MAASESSVLSPEPDGRLSPVKRLWNARLWLVLGPVKLYQFILAPLIPAGRCRFQPGCSRYTLAAVRHHGLIKGTCAGIWRLLRCQPWGGSGLDPVEDFCWPWQVKRRAEVRRIRAEREAEVDRMAAEMQRK